MLSVKNLRLNENVYQYNSKKVNEAGEVSIKKVEINNILTDTLLNADKEDIIDTLISYLSKTQKEELLQNIIDNKWYDVYESLALNEIIVEVE